MTKWIDSSSYSRNDKERIPNIWKIKFGAVSITVAYGHVTYAKQWIIRCDPFFDNKQLGNISEAEAKTLAIKMVKDQLSIALQEISQERVL